MKRILLLLLFILTLLKIQSAGFSRELFSVNAFEARLIDRPYISYRSFFHNNPYSYAALELVNKRNPAWGFNVGYFFLSYRQNYIREFENYDNDPMVLTAEYFFSFSRGGYKDFFLAFGLGYMVGVTIDWELLDVLGKGTFSIIDLQAVDYSVRPVFNFITVPFFSLRGVIRL